ncbi:unnamed protein product [Protopolystoma xenopodis]|uniref:PKD domain-containing protein n=1 Tax=Protopolystoma xenopodis TaxID=117903 RepID=A0A3S5BPW8_9PLAT|nr:unnamed protein product [Protopolystoma xenopodis]
MLLYHHEIFLIRPHSSFLELRIGTPNLPTGQPVRLVIYFEITGSLKVDLMLEGVVLSTVIDYTVKSITSESLTKLLPVRSNLVCSVQDAFGNTESITENIAFDDPAKDLSLSVIPRFSSMLSHWQCDFWQCLFIRRDVKLIKLLSQLQSSPRDSVDCFFKQNWQRLRNISVSSPLTERMKSAVSIEVHKMGQVATLTLSLAAGSSVYFRFNFGDNSSEEQYMGKPLTSPAPEDLIRKHIYTKPGDFEIVATASSGGSVAQATRKVHVEDSFKKYALETEHGGGNAGVFYAALKEVFRLRPVRVSQEPVPAGTVVMVAWGDGSESGPSEFPKDTWLEHTYTEKIDVTVNLTVALASDVVRLQMLLRVRQKVVDVSCGIIVGRPYSVLETVDYAVTCRLAEDVTYSRVTKDDKLLQVLPQSSSICESCKRPETL